MASGSRKDTFEIPQLCQFVFVGNQVSHVVGRQILDYFVEIILTISQVRV